MSRPSRAAAKKSASKWKANMEEFDGEIVSSADEDEYAAPAGRARAAKAAKKRKRADSDDDASVNSWASDASSDDGSYEFDDEDEDDDEPRHRREELEPPEDTSPEAALDSAIAALRQRRKDVKRKIDETAHADAMAAAQTAHAACLKRGGRRASRNGAHDVTAYYHAEAAAAKVLRSAYPPIKAPARPTRRAAAAESTDGQAEIEKERRRNIQRNQAVLVELGLA